MPRVLGLDIGEVRIGVALSDAGGILASPLTIIDGTHQPGAIDDILKIIREQAVARIIAGFPYSLDGRIGPQAEKVQAFITALQQQTDVPIELRDERYTTMTAIAYKKEASKKKPDRKTRYDAIAAAIILQEYLNEQGH
ncbi:MAG: Holliday junction resolvase RuvX [Dehalococcoidales bacterium]|nr:Holliday junction resolvase RuvX [Dehalococcoidales bacterium]